MPDTTLPPPLTMKDIEKPAAQAAPAPIVKDEPKQTATTPAAEPAKAAPTATAGSEIGDKLRELITSKQFDRLVPRKADRAGIEAYYSGRNYAPLWVTNNAINDRAKSASAYLAQVDAVGLDPNDYLVPRFQVREQPGRAGRGRAQTDALRADVCASRGDRPYPFHPRRLRHPVRPGAAGSGERSGKARRGQRCRQSSRRLQSAPAGIQGAEGQACGIAQGHARHRPEGGSKA